MEVADAGSRVIPLGFDIILHGSIINTGERQLTIESPATTQKIMVHLKSEQDTTETTFLLNPSHMDALGEITIPPRTDLVIKPHKETQFTISLYSHVMDKCFIPGVFTAALSYDTVRSEPLLFTVKFTKNSVGRLLTILNDPKNDLWIRKESYRLLKKVKPDFVYNFNENSVESFNYWWDKEKDSRQVDSLIDTFE